MKFESEYMPTDPGEDKVFVLEKGRAVELDIPDDDGETIDEEEPHVEYD